MKNLIRLLNYSLFLFILMISSSNDLSGQNTDILLIDREIQLQALVENIDNDSLKFVLKNISGKEFLTTNLGDNRNRIIIKNEYGEELKYYTWASYLEPIVIKPKETLTWTKEIWSIQEYYNKTKFSDFFKLNQKYQFFWEINKHRSRPIEILIKRTE